MHTLRIDGYIGKEEGMSALFGQETFSLRKLITFLDALPRGTRELKVEINSGGGSVTEGFAIHDKLVSSGLTIYTEVLGLCGSISTIIALAAKKEHRSMHTNSEYFIHNPFWQPMGPDALEADDLQKIADDLRASEERILKFYAEKTGQPAATLQSFMDRAKSFSAAEAKRMGFVSSIIGDSVNSRKYHIAAFIDTAKNTNTHMDFSPTQKSWIEQKFNDFTRKFNRMFVPAFKAMVVDLESGGQIFIDTEDEEWTGKNVFTVDEEGNPTSEPTPDGEYVTHDGRTIVVKDGVVEQVAEAATTEASKPAEKAKPAETIALKKQIAELTAQLNKANLRAMKSEKKKLELETSVTTLKSEVDKFKNMVLGSDLPPAGQHFKGGDHYTKSQAQLLKEYQEAKKKK